MAPARRPDDTAPNELLRRTRDAPETVEIADVVAPLEDEIDRETGARAVLALCEPGPDARSDVIEDLAGYLEKGSVAETPNAAFLLGVVAREYPDDARAAVPALAGALDGSTAVPGNVLRTLAAIADAEPASVADALPAVGSHLTNGPLPVRRAALAVVASVADADPTLVEPAVPALVDVVADAASGPAVGDADLPGHVRGRLQDEAVDTERLQQRAASVLLAVAERDPGAVEGDLPTLRSVLAPGVTVNPRLRGTVLELLETVADADASPVLALTAALVEVVRTEDRLPALQASAARTLAVLADAEFETVTDAAQPAIPTLGGLLDADDPDVRGAAAGLLSYLAERHPEPVGRQAEALIALLDDEHIHVRGSAVWALGYADAEGARDALRETATADPDETIRALARDVLARTADE